MEYLFLFLLLNFGVQVFRKGQIHLRFLNSLSANPFVKNDSFLIIFILGQFYKYPMLILPFSKRYVDLGSAQDILYRKLKYRIILVWLSLLSIVIFLLIFPHI